ncbi:MutS-related protein [Mechercharimyces sp. CAU 1602]|uniref:lysine 5,6-aminomutase reactivase ATPase KamC n=1 Tax=Mechercharimyces sp. CAU 1602 TaxID=2973933 RepID=UPI00216161B8|nr:hypothetical protein [Mechercharimyces sp. CAU 1602]MCS1352634.1 hypothetical protein [Mechercharimyces sp. CAU 1602]
MKMMREGMAMFITEQTSSAIGFASLWSRLRPLTPMGRQRKGEHLPFLPGEEERWQQYLDQQQTLWKTVSLEKSWGRSIEHVLSQVPDVEPILRRLDSTGQLALADWFGLKQFLWQGERLAMLLKQEECVATAFAVASLPWQSLLRILNPAPKLTPTFSVDAFADSSLQRWKKTCRQSEQAWRTCREREIKAVEMDYDLRRTRDEEWIVARESPHLERLKQDARLRVQRETMFDVIFIYVSSEEVRAKQLAWEEAEADKEKAEQQVLAQLSLSFRPHHMVLLEAVEAVARLDLQWVRMRMAMTWAGRRPLWEREQIELQQAYHPLLKEVMDAQGGKITPIDICVRRGGTVIIGPNMGGKTMVLKTIGLICALSQYGFFVPAQGCHLPLLPYIEALIGDDQDFHQGLSSFGAQVVRLKKVLARENEGLLLLDEIGRGTNPVEGAALSTAITAFLSKKRHWTIHITHYHDVLTVFGIARYRVAGLRATKKGERDKEEEWVNRLQACMDYRLLPVTSEESVPYQALQIALRLGLPAEIVSEAEMRMKEGRKD